MTSLQQTLFLFYSEVIGVVEMLLCVVYSVYTRRKKAAKTFGQQEIKAIALSGSSAHDDAMIAVLSHATLPHHLQLYLVLQQFIPRLTSQIICN